MNVSGIKSPNKRHRPAKWIEMKDPYICCIQEIHHSNKDKCRLKVTEWRKKYNMLMEIKMSRSGYPNIRQSRPFSKLKFYFTLLETVENIYLFCFYITIFQQNISCHK